MQIHGADIRFWLTLCAKIPVQYISTESGDISLFTGGARVLQQKRRQTLQCHQKQVTCASIVYCVVCLIFPAPMWKELISTRTLLMGKHRKSKSCLFWSASFFAALPPPGHFSWGNTGNLNHAYFEVPVVLRHCLCRPCNLTLLKLQGKKALWICISFDRFLRIFCMCLHFFLSLVLHQSYFKGWPEPCIYRYIRCIHGICGREITIHTVWSYDGVYVRFWPTLYILQCQVLRDAASTRFEISHHLETQRDKFVVVSHLYVLQCQVLCIAASTRLEISHHLKTQRDKFVVVSHLYVLQCQVLRIAASVHPERRPLAHYGCKQAHQCFNLRVF